MPSTIITERCRLEPLGLDDGPELHALWTSPEVRRFLWDDELIPPERTEELLAESVAHLARGEYGLWGARLRGARLRGARLRGARLRGARPRGARLRGARLEGEDALVGFTGFWPFHEPRRIELLFGLAPDYWGQGYATEIARAMMNHGRAELSITTMLASTDTPNHASIAVLERLGMRCTGIDETTGTVFFAEPLPDTQETR